MKKKNFFAYPSPDKLFQLLEKSGLDKDPYFQSIWLEAVRNNNYVRIASTLRNREALVRRGLQQNQFDRMSEKEDPFHPRPTDNMFYGDVFVGYILNPINNRPMSWFRLSLDEFTRHMAIFGGTGSGKTNQLKHICAQIINTYGDDVRIIVIDPKKGYREHLHPQFITLSFDDFKDEMFERPTEDIPQHIWSNLAIEANATEMYFLATSKNQLLELVTKLMSKSSRPFPTHAEILEEANKAIRLKGLDFRRREALGTIIDRFTSLHNHEINCKNISIPTEELMNQNIIFEVDENIAEIAAFRLGLLITKIYTTKKYGRQYGKNFPTTIILYDEARQQFTQRNPQFGTSILDKLLPLIREFKIGFILATQEPRSISPVARANTFTKMAFPLLDGADEFAIRGIFGLNKDQSEYYRKLSGLPMGNSIVRYGNYPISFPLYIPKFPDRLPVSVEDIEERKSEFLDKFVIPEAPTPIVNSNSNQISDLDSIPLDAATILKTLNQTPFLNYTSLLKTANLTPIRANEARDWLVKYQYVNIERILVNKTGKKSLFLDLTEKSYMALQTNKPYSGKVSFTHRIYANLVATKLRADDWNVTIEAITTKPGSQHKMDILAMRHGENLDYEITISTANVEDNIINGFQDNRITKVIIVADRKALQECKTKTAHLMVEYEGRIEFKPISDFF